MTDNKPTISVKEDGPYLAKNFEHVATASGELETSGTIALCRCGGSNSKPFCDGTHSRNGFSGDNTADAAKNRRDTYVGAEITVHDNRSICAHAGRCTDGLPSVFRLRQEPWIDADGATADEVIATVGQCPSGALSYSIDGVEQRGAQDEPRIAVVGGGPYVLTGDCELVDVPRAEGALDGPFTLCRCGGSKNKPFCDGTHWNVDFDDAQ